MRTVRGHQSHVAARVAEGHEVLAEQPDLLRRAIGLGQLCGGQERQPVLAEQVAHLRAAADAAEQLVIFSREHGFSPYVYKCLPFSTVARSIASSFSRSMTPSMSFSTGLQSGFPLALAPNPSASSS